MATLFSGDLLSCGNILSHGNIYDIDINDETSKEDICMAMLLRGGVYSFGDSNGDLRAITRKCNMELIFALFNSFPCASSGQPTLSSPNIPAYHRLC